jgi:hypothetical protein
MAKAKLDKDTQAVLNEQQKLNSFVQTDAWKTIKTKFIEKIRQNVYLNGLVIKDNTSNEQLLRELTARSLASQMALEWLSEIEGGAAQYHENLKLLTHMEEEQIFSFLPNPKDE